MTQPYGFLPPMETDWRKEEMKKGIRKAANRCGIVLILMLTAMYILSFGLVFLGNRFWVHLPAAVTESISFYDAADLLLNLMLYVVVVPVLIWLCNKKSGVKAADYLRFPDMPAKSVWKLILMGLGVVYVSSVVGNILYSAIENSLARVGIVMNSPDISVDRNPVSIAVLLLGTIILAPLFEELMTRCGLVGLTRNYGGVFTAIVTGVLFGFMHTSFQQVYFAAMMGIYAGFVAYRTRSVWPTILLHFIVNTISAVQVIFLSFSDLDLTNLTLDKIASDFSFLAQIDSGELWHQVWPLLVVQLLSLLLMVLGMIGIIILMKEIKRNPKEFSLPQEKKESPLTTAEKCQAFFFAPGVICFLALSFLLSFANAFFT